MAKEGSATYLVKLFGLAIVYVAVARVGLRLDAVGGFATLVWPPTGLSLAALVIFGLRLWPGVALGAFIVNRWTGAPVLVACGIAVGNTLEAVLGAWALRRIVRIQTSLGRLRDVLGLTAAAVTSTIVSATLGVLSLVLGGVAAWAGGLAIWRVWWLGGVLGDLVVAPLLLTWSAEPGIGPRPQRLWETGALALSALLLAMFIFARAPVAAAMPEFSRPYFLFPLVIWASVRFGQRGATVTTLVVSTIAIWGTALGRGPFVQGALHDRLGFLQAFVAVVAVTALVLGAVTAERDAAARERGDLLTREQAARAAAEASERHVLEQAGQLLASSLDYETTLKNIARLAVPTFADFCMVDLVREPNRIERVAIAHADPEKEALLWEMQARYPPEMGSPHPGARAIQSGEPELLDDMSEEDLRRNALDPEHAALARRIGITSHIAMPFKSHGKLIGVLGLGLTTRSRRFSDSAVELAGELGRRAAAAIENASLYKAAEQSRAEAEAQRTHLHSLFMQAPAAVAIFRGPTHIVELANPLIRGLVGERDVLGKPFRVALPELEEAGLPATLDRVYRTGEPFRGTEFRVRFDRLGNGVVHEGFYDFVLQPTRDPTGGAVDGVMIYAVEVTDQVLARRRIESLLGAIQRSESQLRLITDAVPAFISYIDCDNRFRFVNETYERWFGIPRNEVIGKHVREVLGDIAYEERMPHLATALAGHEVKFEARLPEKNGVRGYLTGHHVPDRDEQGRVRGCVELIADVTDQMLARNKAERLANQLQQAVRAREEFLSIASHELRTPLTSLQLQLESLFRTLGRQPEEALASGRITKSVEAANKQTYRLTRLVEELLDVSRIVGGKLRLQPEEVDLPALVQEVAERLGDTLAAAGNRLHMRADVAVRGCWDRLRIEQVVTNLLTNAIKYGAGQPIEIIVDGDARRARLVVRDHGIGISAEDQLRIFERFERAVSARNVSGFGLGLWISKNLVDAHGGRIRVDSQPGDGSEFTVELPLDRSPTTTG